MCFIYKDLYDALGNAAADPAGDLTRLSRHSLEVRIKSSQHICIITAPLCMRLRSSVMRTDFIAGAQDNKCWGDMARWPKGRWWEGAMRAKTQTEYV